MQKKTKWCLFGILLIFCMTIVCFIYFVPQKYFQENDDFEINQVIYYASDYTENDITNKLDSIQLRVLMGNIECTRYRISFAPYLQKDVMYEIHGRYQQKPIHVILGQPYLNYIYTSSEKGGYKIKNADEILEELKRLRNTFQSS